MRVGTTRRARKPRFPRVSSESNRPYHPASDGSNSSASTSSYFLTHDQFKDSMISDDAWERPGTVSYSVIPLFSSNSGMSSGASLRNYSSQSYSTSSVASNSDIMFSSMVDSMLASGYQEMSLSSGDLSRSTSDFQISDSNHDTGIYSAKSEPVLNKSGATVTVTSDSAAHVTIARMPLSWDDLSIYGSVIFDADTSTPSEGISDTKKNIKNHVYNYDGTGGFGDTNGAIYGIDVLEHKKPSVNTDYISGYVDGQDYISTDNSYVNPNDSDDNTQNKYQITQQGINASENFLKGQHSNFAEVQSDSDSTDSSNSSYDKGWQKALRVNQQCLNNKEIHVTKLNNGFRYSR